MNVQNLLAASGHLAGMVVVIFALLVLWGLTELMGWVVRAIDSASRPASTVELAAPAPVGAVDSSEVSDEASELVVVAAAVTMMLGSNYRVVSVEPSRSAWADHGRRDIHASHRVR